MRLINHYFGDTKEVLLMPVGDIQYAGDEAEIALGMLQRHIQWGVDKGAYFIGMGDYIDTFSPSNRAAIRSAKLYDTARAALDRDAKARVEELYEKALAPSKGRWLGLLEGHHYHEFQDSTTSDEMLADMLQTEFLGTSTYVNLRFRDESRHRGGDVRIWAHHGAGSGALAGSALNKIEKVAGGFDADIYLMGHQHKKNAYPLDYGRPIFPRGGGEPKLVHSTKLLVVTGSFLKGYVADRKRGGYVEQAMLNPVSLGGVLVFIRPRWSGEKDNSYWNPDLHAEV